MFISPETISFYLPSFDLEISSFLLILATLIPFLGMSCTGKDDHEDCDCEHHGEHHIDLESLEKNVVELENVSSRTLEQTEQLAELYVVWATCKYGGGEELDGIIDLLAKAEDILKEALAEKEDDEIRRRLGNVSMHRAEVYNDFDEVDLALEYYEKSIDTFKPLDDKGDGEAKYDIAGIRLNRGTIYHEIGEFEKARADLDDSFMAYRAVEKISDLDTRYYMAKVSVAQGSLMRDMGEPLEKIVDAYNRAMRLFVELIDIGQIEHERDLANVLMDRCTATYEDYLGKEFESEEERQNKFGDILVNVERGVEILEKIVRQGHEEARYDLFNALLTEGSMLLDIERYAEAYKIFERVVNEFSEFANDSDPVLLNFFATAHENRGICSLNLDNPDEALADIGEAIRLREKIVSEEFGLDEDSKAIFISGLATTLANRANAHFSKGDTDKAMTDGQRGLDLIRSLDDEDGEFREIEQLFESLLDQWK